MHSRRSMAPLLIAVALAQLAVSAPPLDQPVSTKPERTKPRSRMSLEREKKRKKPGDYPVGYR